MNTNLKQQRFFLNLNQTIALTFLGIIIVGATILALPISSLDGTGVGFTTAFFSATSAVCVTGLSTVDVATTYSFFGQCVFLVLMETGGLGFMSILSLLFFITKHKSDIRSLSLTAESLGTDVIKHIGRIQRRLIYVSFGVEGIGAIILFFCFRPIVGNLKAIWYGIFHSVSAFCNAGFDLMGVVSPGSSLTTLQSNPIVLITIGFLITIGGIGFLVWDDIATAKYPRNWSFNTKLVLSVTLGLIVVGTVLFFILEYNNPQTLQSMSMPDKILNAFFQSVTTRTAGFAGIDQGDLTESSKAVTIVLMMIGGSPGSTAGGIKTVTFLILVKAIFSNIFGNRSVVLMHRTITNEQVTQALTVVGSFVMLSLIGGLLIDFTSVANFGDSYYESVSALATVGLSVGITDSLSVFSKIILVIFMYFGRVGLLTLTIGFFKAKNNANIKYPSAKIMIG